MIKLNCDQNSPEWLHIKLGVVSASNFNKVVTSKGEPSKQATNYMYQLAGQIVSDHYEETYKSNAMARGLDMEAEAVGAIEIIKGIETEKIGFCYKDESKRVGCSPDRLIVGEKGLVEVKCPLVQTQVTYLLANKLPTDYIQQVQGQLYVTGYEYCYFVSYYPGLKPLVVRVERDTTFIDKLSKALNDFCDRLGAIVEKIK